MSAVWALCENDMTLREYCEQTSLHGWFYIFSADRKLWKTLWSLVSERESDIIFLKHDSSIIRQPSNTMSFMVEPSVLRGQSSIEPNLFHHEETTYRVG